MMMSGVIPSQVNGMSFNTKHTNIQTGEMSSNIFVVDRKAFFMLAWNILEVQNISNLLESITQSEHQVCYFLSGDLFTSCLPPVCTGFHRFLSVHGGWRTCLQSEESGPIEPVGSEKGRSSERKTNNVNKSNAFRCARCCLRCAVSP